jgi:hypothetical protein
MPGIAVLIVFALLMKMLLSLLWAARRTGVAATPSSPAEREAAAALIADVDAGLPIMDLGSGWGGMVRYLARRFPDRSVSGIEAAWLPWLVSAAGALFSAGGHPRFIRGDFMNAPLESRRVYVCYLSGPAMRRLRRRFEEDRPMGGSLVSLAFAMPGWTPSAVLDAGGLLGTPAYRYDFPAGPQGPDV